MKLGNDVLISAQRALIEGKRVGLLAHEASVTSDGRHIVDVLGADRSVKLTTLFGPEHGIATKAQDMEPVASFNYPGKDATIPVYSLYGDDLASLTPTKEMLEGIDVLVIDLQDIGSRYYTYVWTAVLCMKACKENGKQVVICDRPNPVNGVDVEGELQHKGFESFVGLYHLPVRHGMTMGEIALYINEEHHIGCDLHVVEMEGWHRSSFWRDTKLAWTNPSPNMRSFNAALLYPGMCLIEGTNISEGRGTDTPFEIVGAPYINSDELIAEFEGLGLEGIKAAPTSFIPMRQKWTNEMCQGVRWMITDERKFKPYLMGLAFIWCVNRLYKNKGFKWRTTPYEFVTERPAIDLLTGSPHFRTHIDHDLGELSHLSRPPTEFLERRQDALLY